MENNNNNIDERSRDSDLNEVDSWLYSKGLSSGTEDRKEDLYRDVKKEDLYRDVK